VQFSLLFLSLQSVVESLFMNVDFMTCQTLSGLCSFLKKRYQSLLEAFDILVHLLRNRALRAGAK
jgi:hypothetical protein